jgi:hypothetical protein
MSTLEFGAVREFAVAALSVDRHQREADALLQRWSRWRIGDRIAVRRQLGYGVSVLAKVLDGMPTTTCPECRGAKKRALPVMAGDRLRIESVDCPACSGLGWIPGRGTPTQINPAFILGRPCRLDDSELLEVDRAVCKLTKKLKKVVMAEYVRYPIMLQRDRAKRVGYSEGHYRKLLDMARSKILRELAT